MREINETKSRKSVEKSNETKSWFFEKINKIGLPWWHSGYESACQCRGHRFEPWSGKIPHAAEQLSPFATATEAHAPRARAPQQEKPPQWEARTLQQRLALTCCK